jgi:hypothetical protein
MPLTFWNAIVMCQGNPRFPSKSVWSSLYLHGRNFMDQSHINKTSTSLIVSNKVLLAMSWFLQRTMCLFRMVMLSRMLQINRNNVNFEQKWECFKL